MSINIGICHRDIGRPEKFGGRISAAKAMSLEPENVLVCITLDPGTDFLMLEVQEARQLADALRHQASVITELRRQKNTPKT